VPVRDLQDDAAMLVEQGGETRLQRVVGDERVDGGSVRHGGQAKVIRTGAPVITRARGFPTGAAPARSTPGPAGAVAPAAPAGGCRLSAWKAARSSAIGSGRNGSRATSNREASVE